MEIMGIDIHLVMQIYSIIMTRYFRLLNCRESKEFTANESRRSSEVHSSPLGQTDRHHCGNFHHEDLRECPETSATTGQRRARYHQRRKLLQRTKIFRKGKTKSAQKSNKIRQTTQQPAATIVKTSPTARPIPLRRWHGNR